jgi:hypothetical protein
MVCTLLPSKIVTRVKRDLRRNMRKPPTMPIRRWLGNIVRINSKEIPQLPPYSNTASLPEEELKEIMMYSIPKSWVSELDRQSKNIDNMSLGQILDFLEGIEMSEQHNKHPDTKVVNNNSNNKKPAKKGGSKNYNAGSNNNGKKEKHCMHHGKNNTHNTDDCKVIQAQFKKSKADGDDNKKNGKGKGKWQDKGKKSAAESQKELAALVQKTAAKAVKDTMNKINKKRGSDSDDEVMAMELSEFDYSTLSDTQLEKMCDGDEVSV